MDSLFQIKISERDRQLADEKMRAISEDIQGEDDISATKDQEIEREENAGDEKVRTTKEDSEGQNRGEKPESKVEVKCSNGKETEIFKEIKSEVSKHDNDKLKDTEKIDESDITENKHEGPDENIDEQENVSTDITFDSSENEEMTNGDVKSED